MRGRTMTTVGAAAALAATAVVAVSGATAAAPKPAKTVTGSLIMPTAHTLKPGTKVSAAKLGARVFVERLGWLGAGHRRSGAVRGDDDQRRHDLDDRQPGAARQRRAGATGR